MKASRMVILFLCLLLIQGIQLWQQERTLYAVFREKERMDTALSGAVMDCAALLTEKVDGKPAAVDLLELEDRFFLSLYHALGIQTDADRQVELQQYIPFLAYVSEEGIQVRHFVKTEAGEGRLYQTVWGDKVPFLYRDGQEETTIRLDGRALDEERQYAVTAVVSSVLEKYMAEFNEIAEQNGFGYEVYIPYISEDDSARLVSGPSVLAVFQGYPLNSTGAVFNRYSIGGARIRRKNRYIARRAEEGFFYHREDCQVLKADGPGDGVQEAVLWNLNSMEECAELGAFPCMVCMR